jgi:hypothetical protein
MYDIIRWTDTGRDTLVTGIKAEDVAYLLHSLRIEFPACVAVKVL